MVAGRRKVALCFSWSGRSGRSEPLDLSGAVKDPAVSVMGLTTIYALPLPGN